MSVGFEFSQTLAGTYHTLAAPGEEQPISITVTARVHDMKSFALDPTARIEGEIDAEGFADHRALEGTLEINPLLRQKVIYDFSFPDNEGRDCRFHGEQDLTILRSPVKAATTLPGSIYVEDEEHARAILRFDIREDLLKLLRSFKPS
jgi:hypothetical protein